MLSDKELARYSRQLLLPEVDIAGQEKLSEACVLLVGAGGLGHPAALYLAAAGVGRLRLLDDDRVELSNLARQIGFRESQLGQFKVEALAATLKQLNPHCRVEPLVARADDALAASLNDIDLVLDCSDNFATRFAVNRACRAAATPLISGAAIRLGGQLACFDLRSPQAPCYRCLFADSGEAELSCSEAGVVGPLVGMVGSFQAFQAIRFLASGGLDNRFWQFDGTSGQWRDYQLQQDDDCPVCHP